MLVLPRISINLDGRRISRGSIKSKLCKGREVPNDGGRIGGLFGTEVDAYTTLVSRVIEEGDVVLSCARLLLDFDRSLVDST